MTSQTHGERTSVVEVLNISIHGIWIMVSESEHFLPYEHFPWFRDATLAQIHDVELVGTE